MTRPTPERLEWIRELSRECYPPDALLDAMDEIDALTQERDEAQAERDRALRIIVRLRRLLLTATNDIRENVRHDPECAMFLGPDERDEDADCDCWVSQALASGEAAIAYAGSEQ